MVIWRDMFYSMYRKHGTQLLLVFVEATNLSVFRRQPPYGITPGVKQPSTAAKFREVEQPNEVGLFVECFVKVCRPNMNSTN